MEEGGLPAIPLPSHQCKKFAKALIGKKLHCYGKNSLKRILCQFFVKETDYLEGRLLQYVGYYCGKCFKDPLAYRKDTQPLYHSLYVLTCIT